MKKPTKPLPPQVKITDPQDRPSSDFHRWLSQFFAWVEEIDERLVGLAERLPGARTFLPAILGSTTAGTPTYSVRTATLERVDNMVTVAINVGLSAKGTMAGNVRIGTLPWLPAQNGMLAVAGGNVSNTAGAVLVGLVMINSGLIELYEMRPTVGLVAVTTTAIANNTQLFLSGSYVAQPLE